MISTIARKKALTIRALPSADDGRAGQAEQGWVEQIRPPRHELFAALGDRSRAETLVWLWQQAAHGLAFAHGQGIVHGDIKPANILINDWGNPMLLDFNLASHRIDVSDRLIGGTLPYASAEQLESMISGDRCDEHGDLFSLAVVFFQLFTGRLPFPVYDGRWEDVVHKMIQDRRIGPCPVRRLVPKIPIDLASILDKCLRPRLSDRYPSATALMEDLGRYLEHKPLRYAPNRSLAVRTRNWMRRHPRLTSASTVAVAAAMMIIIAISLLFASWSRNARMEAVESMRRWSQELRSARLPLSTVDAPAATLTRHIHQLESLLANQPAAWPFRTGGLPREGEMAGRFSDDVQYAVDQLVAGRLALAGSLLRRLNAVEDFTQRHELVEKIQRQHELIAREMPPAANGAGLLMQKSRLAEYLGHHQQAQDLMAAAESALLNQPYDRIAVAYHQLSTGNPARAAGLLQESVAADPLDFEAWLLLGNAEARAGRVAQAEACFTVCLGLDPQSEIALYNRAMARMDLGDLEGARRDYDLAIRLNPREPAYFANRALIAMSQQDWHRALRDLSDALTCAEADPRVYYLRHQVHLHLGNEQMAADDLNHFLQSLPTDVEGWIVRGLAFLQQGDREQALRDLEQALRMDANSTIAWQNKAAVLAESPSDLGEALAAMTRIVELEPLNATALATRGVLWARAGDRESALADAREALQLDSSPDIRYRVAGIYALTSRQVPADRDQAIVLVALAILDNPRLVMSYWPHDPDLEPLLNDPRMIELTRALERIQHFSGEQ